MKFLLVGAALAVLSAQAQTPASLSIAAQQNLVNQYCAGCHNEKLKSGGFSWSKIDLAHPDQQAEQIEKVIRKVRAGMMPPSGLPRPDSATLRAFANSVAANLDKVAGARPNAGAPDLHRLNRTEYHNAVQDLLDLDVDVTALLPPDDMSHGFDNMADALSVTPALMQGYVRAAGKIARLAVGDKTTTSFQTRYNVPKVVNQMRHVDGAPFGTRGGTSVMHTFPADGEYKFSLTMYYYYLEQLFGIALPENLAGQEIEISIDGERVSLFRIDAKVPETKASFITPLTKVTAGPHRVSAAFLDLADGPVVDTVHLSEQVLLDVSIGLQPGMTTLPQLHTLTVEGPLKIEGVSETPSRRKVFICSPGNKDEELPCAKKIISSLGRQAFRRPVTESDVDRLLGGYQFGRNEGDFESGVRMAIQSMIADPQFVFRFERTPASVAPGSNYRISDLELASRLSFFLWSAPPDNELLTVASQNRLHESDTLDKQVRRMLSSPRADALTQNFATQWLHLQNLKEADPDGVLFPEFTRNLGQSMVRETQMLFGSVMRENRSIVDLLTANYTFVDEVLAKHYRIPNVMGTTFRKVSLSDPNRFGLLGQGSILTLTSQANRTSPVQRGKYVMEVILGTPPPTAPPNVPPLKENMNNETPLSVRERMEQHRANEPCASCHKMMDPIGLSLENYDAVGLWREKDAGAKVDSSGIMYDGSKLSGPVTLRDAVLSHQEAYINNFAENLLAYGVGRVLDSRDLPSVRGIEQAAAKSSYRFNAFVMGVIKSPQFQMRHAEEAQPPATAAANHIPSLNPIPSLNLIPNHDREGAVLAKPTAPNQ